MPDGQELAEARTTLAAARLDDAESLGLVQGIRFTDAGAEAAREALESGVTGDALWTATWVYATSGTDPAPLQPLLEDEDPTIRAIAAAALLSLGDAAAFDPLVELLDVDEHLRGSEPPLRVWEFAAHTLGRYVGEGPALESDTATAAVAVWAQWVEDHRASLTFDPETGTWSAG